MAKVRIEDKTYELEDFNSVEPIVVNKSSKRTSGEVLTVSRDCKARLKGVPDEKHRVIIRGLSETTNPDDLRKYDDRFYVDYSTGEVFFNQAQKLESFDVEEYYIKANRYIDYSMVTVGNSLELGRPITLKEYFENGEFAIGTGGGGGTSSGGNAKITSSFSQKTCTSDETLTIDYFFSSPNVGNGMLYVSVNKKEVIKESIPQGKGTIKLNKFSKGINIISIYVVDNGGLYTNELNYKVSCGSLEISSSFSFEKDYQVSSIIKFPFTLNTIITEGIKVHFEIDGNDYVTNGEKGYNTFTFPSLGIGVHKVKIWAECDEFISNVLSDNLVILSGENLYISTNFTQSKSEEGDQVSIDFRISMLKQKKFDVELYIDNHLFKTLECKSGINYWNISTLKIGKHKLSIKGITKDKSQTYTLDINLEIIESSYEMQQPVTQGLMCWFDAVDKSNQSEDRDKWEDKSGNNTNVSFYNMNYSTNGWNGEALLLDGKAYAEIDITPFDNNAEYGLTIDVLFETENIGNEEARVLDCTSTLNSASGIYVNTKDATIKSIEAFGTTPFAEKNKTRITWVIDRDRKFAQIYVNAVLCENLFLSDDNEYLESFQHDQKIYLNSLKGNSNYGKCKIYTLRVYERALSHEEILQNHIADIKNKSEQKKKYDFNFNDTMPTMYLYGDTTAMTKDFAVPMRVKYISPSDEYGQSFDLDGAKSMVSWQGTSSLQYAVKNYKIKLKDNEGNKFKYTPFENGIEESTFCLKCDYIESSHANNTGLAKFVNSCLYNTPVPPQVTNPKVRTTINGFPIQLYINDELIGVFNFNLDKGCTDSFGFTEEFPNAISYEVKANSDTTVGAFFKWDSSKTSKTMEEYYANDFELRYALDEDNQGYDELHRVVSWVNDADDKTFKNELEEYFNKEYLIKYFLMVMMFGMVDNLGKNMMLSTFDGKIWYPTFYDLDTALGLDNSGYLIINSDIEMKSGTFNTSNSQLWVKLQRVFADEILETYKQMRSQRFTLSNMMKYLCEEQIEKISERLYNLDAENKYLKYKKEYIHMLHGNRLEHMKRWLTKRLLYVDTLLGYEEQTKDFITIRANKKGYVTLGIKTYSPMYLSVKWRNGEIQTKRIDGSDNFTYFNSTLPTATDQEIIIYGAKHIKEIDGLSKLNPSALMFGNAVKLTKLECTDSKELLNINVSGMEYLQVLDLRNCIKLGTLNDSSIDVSNCTNLKYLYVKGSAVTNIIFAKNGCNIEEMSLNTTMKSLTLMNMPNLTTIDISYSTLNYLNITNCPILDSNIIYKLCDSKLETLIIDTYSCDVLQLENYSYPMVYNLATVSLNNIKCNDLTLPAISHDILQSFEMNNINTKILRMNLINQNSYDTTIMDFTKSNIETLTAKTNTTLRSLFYQGCIIFKLNKNIKNIVFDDSGESSNGNMKIGAWIPELNDHEDDWIGVDIPITLQDSTLRAFNTNYIKNFHVKFTGNTVSPRIFRNLTGLKEDSKVTIDFSKISNDTKLVLDNMCNYYKSINNFNIIYPNDHKIRVTSMKSCFSYCTISNDDEIYKNFFDNVILDNADLSYSFSYSNFNCDIIKLFQDCEKIGTFNIYGLFKNATFDENIIVENCNFLKYSNIGSTSSCTCFEGVDKLNINTMYVPNSLPSYKYLFSGNIIINNIIFEDNFTSDNLYGLFYNNKTMVKAPICEIPDSVVDLSAMFYNCDKLININNVIFNKSKSYNCSSMFYSCDSLVETPIDLNPSIADNMYSNCTSLTEIKGLDKNTITSANTIFSECKKLKTITMNFSNLDSDSENMFYYTTNLENIEIVGEIKTNILQTTYSSFGSYLTVESLLNILNALEDRSNTTSKTLSWKTSFNNKLTSKQLAIATNKNWILSIS